MTACDACRQQFESHCESVLDILCIHHKVSPLHSIYVWEEHQTNSLKINKVLSLWGRPHVMPKQSSVNLIMKRYWHTWSLRGKTFSEANGTVVSAKVHLTKFMGQACQSRPIFQNIWTTGNDLFHFSFHFHFCPEMHKKKILPLIWQMWLIS